MKCEGGFVDAEPTLLLPVEVSSVPRCPVPEGCLMPWVLLDVGCRECGVETLFLGIYATKEAAEAAGAVQDKATDNWRDGGQSGCEVHEWNGAFAPEAERKVP